MAFKNSFKKQHFPNTPLENNLLHLHITGRLLKVLATLSPLPPILKTDSLPCHKSLL